MFCSNCGNKLVDGAKFCSFCGNRVADAEPRDVRTISGIEFEEPKVETEPFRFPADRIIDEAPEKPKRERMSFDWSNVVEEPRRRETPEIRSPWDTSEKTAEEKPLLKPESRDDQSRTMSFIDVLKAEKLEKEKAAADKAIEYTQVLEIGPELEAFDEPPRLHFAPLYEDVDEHVVSPFDDLKPAQPEERIPETKIEAETERAASAIEEPAVEVIDSFETEKPAEPVSAAEPKTPEWPESVDTPEPEPEIPEVEVSRETIAEFDEYVKSFEREAGIIHDEPAIEESAVAAGTTPIPKFELPDFLKNIGSKYAADAEEPESYAPVETEDEPLFEEPRYDEGFIDFDEYTEAEAEEETEETELFEETDAVKEEPADSESLEDELFREMEESRPNKTGMTIAGPADTESEIEALKKRLAELTGTPEPAEANEPVEEPEITENAEPEESVEPEAPVETGELFDAPSDEELDGEYYYKYSSEEEHKDEHPEFLFDSITTPAVEELFDGLTPDGVTATEAQIEDEYLNTNIEETAEAEPEMKSESPVYGGKHSAPADEEDDEEEAEADEPETEPAEEVSIADTYLDLDLKADAEADTELEEAVSAEPVVIDLEKEPASDEEPVAEAEPIMPVEEELAAEVEAEPEDFGEPVVIDLPAEEAAAEEKPVPDADQTAEDPIADAYLDLDIQTDHKEVPALGEESAAEPAKESDEEPAPVALEEAPAEEHTATVDDILKGLAAVAYAPTEAPAPAKEPEPAAANAEPVSAPAEESVPVFKEEAAEATDELEKKLTENALAADESKDSDALSLEELELNLFGEVPTEEAEAEETIKIDKFYTLYRKNEEFQRLLDEEYDKLKSGGQAEEDNSAETAAEEAAEPQRVEDNKAYRQVEDETIYMPKEAVEAQIKAETAAVLPEIRIDAPKSEPAEVKTGEVLIATAADGGDIANKKEDKKAEKARRKEEKRRAKAEARDASGVEYEDVESGSGFLTVLAVIIAVILVILLAVILVLQVAPDSGAAAWINEFIGRITQNIGAVDTEGLETLL